MNDQQSAAGVREASWKAMNRLAKWRTIFVGWIWGSKAATEPGVQGMRDLMERQLMLRVDVNAITALMIEKGYFTREEYMAQIVIECDEMQKMLEEQFPGIRATDSGLSMDPKVASETMRELGFPQ